MGTKQINYKGSKYSFEFDDEKEWTKEDYELYDGLLTVMQHQEECHKKVSSLLSSFCTLDKELKLLDDDLKVVEKDINDLSAKTDEISAKIVMLKITDTTLLSQIVSDSGTKLMDFDKKLRQLAEHATPVFEEIKKDDDKDDDEDPEWKKFNKIVSRHYENYAMQAIDICSFDDMMQKLYGAISLFTNHDDSCDSHNDRVISDYNVLMAKITGLYALWAEYQKRATLLDIFIKNNKANETAMVLN